jgi:DNA polymerase III epsilon subunit-like protein
MQKVEVDSSHIYIRKERMKHIMVDLETLGTAADSVILSIGAVRFDLDSGVINDEGFYSSISIESNQAWKRRISEDTLLWWFKQDAAARQVFFEPKETLEESLVQFSDWVGNSEHLMWSNGADFDLPMLAHAYSVCGIEVPWKFWNSRCFRTYKNLPGAKAAKLPAQGVKHNAMADAYSQAMTVCAIHKTLFSKEKAKT